MKHSLRSALSLCPLVALCACVGSPPPFTREAETSTLPPPAAAPEVAPIPIELDPSDAPSAPVTGEVAVVQWPGGPQVLASFWRTEGRAITRGCRASVVAGCELRRCDPGVEDAPTPPDAVASVGEAYIDGLSPGTFPLRPGDGARYRAEAPPWFSVDPAAWEGGDTLTLRADGVGRGVRAFVLRLSAPSPVQVTSGAFDGAARRVDAPLPFAWQGGATGVVEVMLRDALASGETVRSRCHFPASAGRARVPAEVLALGAACAAPTRVFVLSVASSRLRTDAIDVRFAARHLALADSVDLR